MMGRVQNAPPENPNAFALYIKEWDYREPPRFILFSHEI